MNISSSDSLTHPQRFAPCHSLYDKYCFFFLGNNKLEGTIPTQLGNLSQLLRFWFGKWNYTCFSLRFCIDPPGGRGEDIRMSQTDVQTSFFSSFCLIDKNDIVGNVDSLFCDESANYTLVDTARFPNLDDLNADCLAALEGNVGVGVVVVPEEIEIVCTCCSECF